MPEYLNQKYYIGQSKIQGRGIMAKIPLTQGQVIDVGIDNHFGLVPYVTPDFGTLINHSWNPTAHLKQINNKHYVVASKNLKPHEEITIDYRETPWYIMGPSPNFK